MNANSKAYREAHKSEITKENAHVGMVIFYHDIDNSNAYEIVEVGEEHIVINSLDNDCPEEYKEDYRFFDELNNRWTYFSGSKKKFGVITEKDIELQ